MRFRKFIAQDMREGLAAVKKELGPDAVIVSTRRLRATGLFSRPQLEITAALEEAAAPAPVPDVRPVATPSTAARSYARWADGPVTLDDSTGPALPTPEDTEPTDPIAELLLAADVSPRVAADLAARIRRETGAASTKNRVAALERALESLLAGPVDPLERGGVARVGPTGVGKTTTIAKLAAHASLVQGRRVVLATTDTYRVGAVEQLQQFAQLMSLPCHVVRDRDGLNRLVDTNADADLVLVDTAGRNPQDENEVRHLAQLFSSTTVTVHLTVAAATRYRELARIVKRFQRLDPSYVIGTKLDEAATLGSLVTAQAMTSLPLSFVTFGQRVPEDISRANGRELARAVLDPAVFETPTTNETAEVRSWI